MAEESYDVLQHRATKLFGYGYARTVYVYNSSVKSKGPEYVAYIEEYSKKIESFNELYHKADTKIVAQKKAAKLKSVNSYETQASPQEPQQANAVQKTGKTNTVLNGGMEL